MTKKQLLKKGLITENPVFVLLLGMCPTLGVTTSLQNALGMGVSVVFVLLFSNILVSCIRKVVPDEIRIPVFIVIIATGVTILEMILNYYLGCVRPLGLRPPYKMRLEWGLALFLSYYFLIF